MAPSRVQKFYAKANHDLRHSIACRNLENARKQAAEECGYSSTQARKTMAEEFYKQTKGKHVCERQLDVAEAIILGLNASVIAGTGAGKTIPYMLVLLLLEFQSKVLVVLSPLKSLQRDQV